MASRMFDAISIFCGIIAGLQRPSPSGARNRSVAMSCDAKSELSKRTSRLAGRAAASTGGMNWPWAITQNRVSTNSCTHHACQRSSVRLGTRIHSVSCFSRQSLRPARKALARTTVAAR
jgi:hypothetical protein